MLVVENIEKSIGGKNIIYPVSFEVPQGQFVTVLGPNGAGKSTTISIQYSEMQFGSCPTKNPHSQGIFFLKVIIRTYSSLHCIPTNSLDIKHLIKYTLFIDACQYVFFKNIFLLHRKEDGKVHPLIIGF